MLMTIAALGMMYGTLAVWYGGLTMEAGLGFLAAGVAIAKYLIIGPDPRTFASSILIGGVIAMSALIACAEPVWWSFVVIGLLGVIFDPT